MCMLAKTGEGPVHKNKSLIMVPMNTKGIERAKKIRKIGMHSSDTGLIYFDEVRVPQRYRIGEEGQGFVYQMQQFQEERLWAAASCLQSLTNCIQWTVEWAQERKLFGSTLADQQWVQFKLAELKTEVEALRALTYRACELYVQGQDVLELASMAKLKAALSCGADAVHPGYGFLSENADFAQAVEDAGLTWIGPPAGAIHTLGNKARAKELALARGIPCLPGYQGADQSHERLLHEAEEIGLPVMVKAAAGGGGRGMRLVTGRA